MWLLCLLIINIFAPVCYSMSRHINARAIPMQDSALDAKPLHEQSASAIKCVQLCAENTKCQSINYHKNKTCQLLEYSLCGGTKSLIPAPGFKYIDVDFDRSIAEINYFSNRAACQLTNKCSPKCKDCTLGTSFINQRNGRISGRNIGFASGTLAQCRQSCSLNPKCRSVEHFTGVNFCTLSAVTIDMVNPGAFESDPTITYLERTCI